MENLDIDKTLRKIYYSPNHSGSFGSRDILYLEARKLIPHIKRKDVNEWLKGQITYTLHYPVKRRFKRHPVIAEYPLENFQADLVDMQEFSRINYGFNYILTIIDVFSKKAWAIALKNKSAPVVCNAFEKVLIENIPNELQTDHGKEFENSCFKNLKKKYEINHYFAKDPNIKCAVIERFNRTLKNKMFKYFTSVGNRKYVTVLPQLIESYNNTYHRSIGMKPNEVSLENKQKVFENLYKVKSIRELLKRGKSSKIKIGDNVRKKYDLKTFDRGYYPNWTDEIFKVNKSFGGPNKFRYLIQDSKGNLINRKLYPEEIQSINNNKSFRVEKIVKQKITKGIKYYLIKWLNFPETDNSWIKATDLFDVNG